MYRLLFMVLSVSASAVGVAKYLDANQDETAVAVTVARDEIELLKPKIEAAKEKANPIRISGTERIPRATNGHFEGNFRLNNTTVHGVIDTGASTIAMNESTARRAGVRLSRGDFIYTVQTANGTAKAARAVLSRVSFGSIRINNVEALVLEDKALNIVLIGMSFMNRLRGFEYKSGSLILRR